MHPIKDTVVQNELQAIKETTGWTILLATEIGSLAQGLESKNNCHNIRFIYLRKETEYLQLHQPSDTCAWLHSPEIEVIGWDLSKFIKALKTSNPYVFEWLNSEIIYEEHPLFDNIRKTAYTYFNIHAHLCQYVTEINNYLRHNKGIDPTPKTYLLMSRMILSAKYVIQNHIPAPSKIEKLLPYVENDTINTIINSLIIDKKCGLGNDPIPHKPILDDWIITEKDNIMKILRTIADNPVDSWEKLNELFIDTIKQNEQNKTENNEKNPTETS